MAILSTQAVGHAFGADDLFSGIDVQLEAKERVGLVGPNGVGKTTLLLILAGLIEPDEGEVVRQNDLTLGYLRQEAVLTFAGQENTVYAEMLTVFGELVAQERELRALEERMAAGETAADLFERYGELQAAYEAAGGYGYQVDIKRVLLGLGFAQADWGTPLKHLSGGQKTRVLLARLLLEKPDLLILDEPTNHLDTAAIEWLERTLRLWQGSLIIVSHDRYFLDKVVNRIWEMAADGIRSYKGDYTSYVAQRQADWEREVKLFEGERERLDAELEFVRRHIAGGKTDIAKGKLKRLTRDIVLIEQLGVRGIEGKQWMQLGEEIKTMSGRVRTLTVNEAARRLRDLKPPSNRPPRLNIKLAAEERSERLVLSSTQLQIGYAGAPLLTTDRLRLERLDRVALIGPNGSGKSTLLRTILGELEPLDGEIRLGDNLVIGYFAQAHDQLNLERRVIDEVLETRPMSEQDARGHLAQYLFRGDDVFKQVGALSGGERGRLALALLGLSGANFLLLDEPTNHLDIPSQEVLQEVLEGFDGTILMVSHDRYLVSHLAEQIWAIEEGHLTVFDGDYTAYLASREGVGAEPEMQPSFEEQILATMPPASELNLDWVEKIVPPSAKGKKRKPHDLESDLAVQDAEIWLAKIEEELAAAQAAGDMDQIEWLEEELARAQSDLDDLLEELED